MVYSILLYHQVILKIIIDSKCIHFTSFMTTHKYEIKDIEKIRIREFYNKKIYLKINDGNLLKVGIG